MNYVTYMLIKISVSNWINKWNYIFKYKKKFPAHYMYIFYVILFFKSMFRMHCIAHALFRKVMI